VTRNDKEVWTAVRGPDQQQLHNAERTYQVFQKRIIDEPVADMKDAVP
jgi:hypothetical protein